MEIFVLYGTKKNDFIEVLITETKDKNHLKKAEIWAERNEFKNIRTVTYNDNIFEMPNFERTINI